MSSAAAHPPSSPPGDEELAALYNQVLIGFAEESPTSEHSSNRLPSPGEREPAYNPYAPDPADSHRSMQTKITTSRPPNPACTCLRHET